MSEILKDRIEHILEKISLKTWSPQSIEDTNKVPTGDMPGDIIKIGPKHIHKAQTIFPKMLKLIIPELKRLIVFFSHTALIMHL